jgi:uncharacterized DUF497 family protein
MKIIWDEKKNQLNIREHKISFQEAETVFYDPNAKIIHDPDHSIEEDRYIILGISKLLKLLIVCHRYNENDETIRIFSSRKAEKKEIKEYGGN